MARTTSAVSEPQVALGQVDRPPKRWIYDGGRLSCKITARGMGAGQSRRTLDANEPGCASGLQ